jgi:hypothetical protein
VPAHRASKGVLFVLARFGLSFGRLAVPERVGCNGVLAALCLIVRQHPNCDDRLACISLAILFSKRCGGDALLGCLGYHISGFKPAFTFGVFARLVVSFVSAWRVVFFCIPVR